MSRQDRFSWFAARSRGPSFSSGARSSRPRHTRRLRLESLEDRRVLANVTVGNLLDVVNGDTSSIANLIANDGGDGISLREAITAANNTAGGDNVLFDSGVFTGGAANHILLGGTQLLITETLTIDASALAENVTIDAQNSSRIFNKTAGSVTIEGVTLTRGLSSTGGAIFNSSGPLTIRSSTLSGNTSTGVGGAIFNARQTLNIFDSTLTGNVAGSYGGAIDSYMGSVAVIGSTVSGNSANFGGGAAQREGGTLTIRHSTFTDNTAATRGGGVFGLVANLVFDHAIVSGNSSPIGAEVEQRFGSAAVDNYNLFGENTLTTAQALVGVTPGVTDLTATSNGTDPAALASILDTTLADNGGRTLTHALAFASPAFQAGDPGFTPPPDFDQRGAGFPRVQLGRIDIGAFEAQSDALAVDTNSDIVDGDYSAGNLSLREAIGLANAFAGGDTITFDAAVFTGGAANEILLSGTELEITETLTIDASLLSENVTIDAQQASRVLRFSAATGDLTLGGLNIQNGYTTGTTEDGGGVRFDSDGTLSLTGSTVSGNTTTGSFADGGGIIARYGSITLTDSTVSGNDSIDQGGGIFAGGSATLTDSTVSGNDSIDWGGGIYARGTATLTDSTVSGNTSGDRGGGIYTFDGDVTLTGSTVSENTSGARGGGISTSDGDVTLIGSTVSGNTSGVRGGGISTSDGDVTLIGSTVSENSAAGTGGGISTSLGSVVTLTDSTVSGNSSGAQGGGVSGRMVTIDRSTVSGNSASGAGGGIFSPSGPVTLTGSTVSGNTSGGRGGGITALVRASVTLTGSTVGGNTSGDRGGGIYSYFGSVTLTGSTVSGNTTTGSFTNGGGIYTFDGDVTLTGSTVSDNTAAGGASRGGGIFAQDGFVTLTGSTVSSNASGSIGNGGGIYAYSASVTLIGSTVSGNTSGDRGGGINARNGGLTVVGSLIAGNTALGVGNEISNSFGTVSLDAYNLIGDSTQTTAEALVGAVAGATDFLATSNGSNPTALGSILDTTLADNGGPTFTHALPAGSPAIDMGNPAASPGVSGVPLFDQRGDNFGRVQNGRIDIGAFEVRDPVSADFDMDGDIDLFDLLALQRGFGTAAPSAAKSQGDADNDLDVDASDLAEWDAAFGQGALPVTASAVDCFATALSYGVDEDEEDLIDAVFGRWS